MANVWEFSPDAGTTKYDITDLQGRDDIDGINLFDYDLSNVKSKNTSGTWSNNTYTINGATFTFNDDKSVTVNTPNGSVSGGTVSVILSDRSNGPYILDAGNYFGSGCPEGGSISTYYVQFYETLNGSLNVNRDVGYGIPFNVDVRKYYGVAITLNNGTSINNLVFKPMITKSEYAGIPYRPYNQQSIQHQINDVTGVTGVRNFAPCTATDKVTNGVTYVINSDKTVAASWSSTPTKDANLTYTSTDALNLIPGLTYKISGCPAGGAWETNNKKYILSVYNDTDGRLEAIDTGNGALFTPVSGKQYHFGITIGVNAGASGSLTFKPMIKLASDPSDEYVPYAMTNRELTERAFNTENVSVTPNSGYTVNFNDLKAKNGLVFGRLEIVKSSTFTLNSWVDIGTASIPPSAFTLSTIVDGENASYVGLARISTNGIIGVFITTNPTNNKFIAPSMMYFIDK